MLVFRKILRTYLMDDPIGGLDFPTKILEVEYFHRKHAYFLNVFYGDKKIIAVKICVDLVPIACNLLKLGQIFRFTKQIFTTKCVLLCSFTCSQ